MFNKIPLRSSFSRSLSIAVTRLYNKVWTQNKSTDLMQVWEKTLGLPQVSVASMTHLFGQNVFCFLYETNKQLDVVNWRHVSSCPFFPIQIIILTCNYCC